MADERNPPGPVPQAFAPLQPSGPHMYGAPPWGGFTPQPPPEPPKKEGHPGIELAIKIIMATLGLGGVIFAGGVAREKLSNIEANQKADAGLRAEEKRQQAARDEAVAKAIEGLREDFADVKADVASLKARRRRAAPRIDTQP